MEFIGFYCLILFLEIIFILIYKIVVHNRSKKIGNIKLTFIGMIMFYIPYNLYYFIYGRYIKYKLSLFDIDGDGIFSVEEQMPEQKIYFNAYINDLGRNLAPITSGLMCIVLFIIMIICAKIIDFIIGRIK
jgi:hypothetical protein